MGVPMIKKCCYCASLHTGTLVIGYLYTIWALVEVTVYTLLVTLAPMGEEGRVSAHKYGMSIAAVAVSGTQLLCSILLIVAAHKKMSSLTLPWTIVTGILTAAFFLLSLTGVSLILQDTGDLLLFESIFIFLHLARACVSVYCIVVVHSRHKQMMQEEAEKRFLHTARYRPVNTHRSSADYVL